MRVCRCDNCRLIFDKPIERYCSYARDIFLVSPCCGEDYDVIDDEDIVYDDDEEEKERLRAEQRYDDYIDFKIDEARDLRTVYADAF